MTAVTAFTINNLAIEIVPTELDQAEALYALVDTNRPTLSKWFSWVDTMQSVVDERDFIAYAQNKAKQRGLFMFTILANNQAIGMIDLHNIAGQQAEFGYWLANNYQGRGIASAAVRHVGEYAARHLNLDHLIIKADKDNLASIRVAQRNGFEPIGDNHLVAFIRTKW
ncbi:GNAT family protein [Leuconostocaceae bacterium ESL0723]|nr:GNAT family protein [Leuconostocaceae bacterium ESL0723]